ncbi:hypothetical protein FACUT_6678 [Fusarium acutatum]|uniref:Uncharacterized protein n=1 Tax=Fusarium acutatum TaxID=78861 RepID=A0A8H4JQ06_9HYPO|nr:hypothetical protein FACUT_6678 [Fusarium acutatum]
MSLISPKTISLVNLPREVLVEIVSYFCLHCRGDLQPVNGVGTPHQHKRRHGPQQPDKKSWYSINKYALFSLAASYKTLHAVSEDILDLEFASGYGDSELSELYTYGRLAEKARMIFIHPKHSNADLEQIVLSLKHGAADLGIDIAKAWRHRAEHFLNFWRSRRAPSFPDEEEYVFMLNSAFTDEIFEYSARSYDIQADDFYGTLHHELIPMLIALLPKLGHIIYKYNSTFEMFQHAALQALEVTELPFLRTLEIDKDIFSILRKAPNLLQLGSIIPSFFGRVGHSLGDQFKIMILRLGDISLLPHVRELVSLF